MTTVKTRKSERDRGAGAEGLRQGKEKELENGKRATVEGGSARAGTVGSYAQGDGSDEPDPISSTTPTERADGSTRRGR